ncbi:MAG: hypothetical protein IKV82_00170, partial [Akkermansia sp.]|nr:hypothetical protein [Akkermansia sp.]
PWKVFFVSNTSIRFAGEKSTFHFLCPDFCYFTIPLENLWDTCGKMYNEEAPLAKGSFMGWRRPR